MFYTNRSSNIIHCGRRSHSDIPKFIPMDATAIYLDGSRNPSNSLPTNAASVVLRRGSRRRTGPAYQRSKAGPVGGRRRGGQCGGGSSRWSDAWSASSWIQVWTDTFHEYGQYRGNLVRVGVEFVHGRIWSHWKGQWYLLRGPDPVANPYDSREHWWVLPEEEDA